MIRTARSTDVGEVANLMIRCHEEAAFQMPALNLRKALLPFFQSFGDGFAVVAESADTVVGCMIGKVGKFWFSDEDRAIEVFTYLLPEHRNSTHGRGLYNAFRRWASAHDLKVVIANSCGLENDRMEKLFSRLGLVKAGSQYIEV